MSNLLGPALFGLVFYLLVVVHPSERFGRWCRIVWGALFIPLLHVLVMLLVQPSTLEPSAVQSAAATAVRLAETSGPGVLTVTEILEACADEVPLVVDVSDAQMETILRLGPELKPPCRMIYKNS